VARRKYTPKEASFIKRHAAGRSYREMAELFNMQHFGLPITATHIKRFMANHGLRNGLDGRFKPGHATHNKGQKGIVYPGSERGWFRRGSRPANYRPAGSERVNADGYVEVKVSDKKKPLWKCKHVAVWEAANGKAPKGHAIVFADGDRRNFDLDNLLLVSRAELCVMNHLGLISFNKNLTEIGKTVADIKLLIGRRKQKPGRRAGKSGGGNEN